MFKSSPSHRWLPNSTTDPQRWLKVCSNDAYPFVLNIATKLPPEDCKAKEPQLYPYCFRPKPWCIFLTKSLSSETAFLSHFRCSERECIIWTYFQSTLGICSAIGKSPMTRTAFKHGYWAAPRGLQSQEVRSHNDIYIYIYPYCARPLISSLSGSIIRERPV